MTRAEEQESLFLVRQDLETSTLERTELSERLLISDSKCENLQQELREKTSKVIRSDKGTHITTDSHSIISWKKVIKRGKILRSY